MISTVRNDDKSNDGNYCPGTLTSPHGEGKGLSGFSTNKCGPRWGQKIGEISEKANSCGPVVWQKNRYTATGGGWGRFEHKLYCIFPKNTVHPHKGLK